MTQRGEAKWAAGRLDRRALARGVVAAAVALALPTRWAGAWQAAPTTLAADWVEADRIGLPLYNTADGAAPPPVEFQADIPFQAIAPHWSGDVAPGAWVEAWFSADGETWSDAVGVGEDPDNGRPGRDGRRFGPLIAAPAGSQFVRYYTYDANGALTTLDGFTWTTIDASAGPSSETFAQQAAGPSLDRPPVISRAEWGCDESLRLDSQGREIWPERYATVEHVIVHHSDTTNFEDPMAGIRSIYYYHTVTKGWGDIGYNYVVDFMGNVYEGRYGGENVVGGHALGYNVGSCGICAMGRFASVQITPEMRSGLTWIVTWASRDLDPLGAADFVDIPKLPTIDGHRDVNPTTCPGDTLYGDLGQLRQDVAAVRDGTAQAALPPAQFAAGEAVVTTTDGGMLRVGPGSEFGLITPVPAGERLTVADGPTTNDGHVWYAVRGSSLGGWIVADVLAPDPDPGGATPEAQPDPGDDGADSSGSAAGRGSGNDGADANGAADRGDGASNDDGGKGGNDKGGKDRGGKGNGDGKGGLTAEATEAQPSAASPPIAPGATATVVDGPLNLRQAAGEDAPVIATLDPGEIVTVRDGPAEVAGDVWYRVETSDGTQGWCAAAYLAAD